MEVTYIYDKYSENHVRILNENESTYLVTLFGQEYTLDKDDLFDAKPFVVDLLPVGTIVSIKNRNQIGVITKVDENHFRRPYQINNVWLRKEDVSPINY
jgi:hypothetical protein